MAGPIPQTPTLGTNNGCLSDNLSEIAYERLEEMIVTAKLRPGSVVSEASLSKHLGVSRTPVREALARLAREHLVRILPQRGIIISEINVKSHLQALEVRRVLERHLSRTAAKRATEVERQRFRALAVKLENAARACEETKSLNPSASPYCSSCWNSQSCDGSAFLQLDRQYCSLVIAASGNEFSADAMRAMGGLSRRFWYLFYKDAADLALGARLRAGAARSVADHDEDGAAEASDRLMDYAEGFTRATLSVDIRRTPEPHGTAGCFESLSYEKNTTALRL